jgi:tetratricopeptide (TPR) repeat protein
MLLMVLGFGLRTVTSSIAFRDAVGETNISQHDPYAVHYGEKLVALSPFNPKAWTAYAKALESNGQTDQALTAYQKALDLNPNAVENLVSQANIYAQKGLFESAVVECQKAEAITPNYTGPILINAVALPQLKRYAEAAREFEKLTVYYPQNAMAYSNLGVCYIQLGCKNDAIDAWKKAYALNPNDPQVIQYLKANGVSLVK